MPSSLSAPRPHHLFPIESPLTTTHQPTTIDYFRFRGDLCEPEIPLEIRSAWQKRFGMTFSQFATALVRSTSTSFWGGELTVQRCDDVLERANFEFHLACREEKRFLALVAQEISFEDDEPIAISLCLETEAGWPLKRRLYSNSIHLYTKIGISQFQVQAQAPDGYTWAKCGFVPDSAEDTWELFTRLQERLDSFELPPSIAEEVRRRLQEYRPENIWAIADLERVRVAKSGHRVSLSRALLESSDYPAVLQLDNAHAVSRFSRRWSRLREGVG